MAAFRLRVVTPDRVVYDGDVTFLMVRTTSGDIGIMAHHASYTAPLAISTMKVEFASREDARFAAIGGGFLKVGDNVATVVTNTCEWQDEIDLSRAEQAAERARAALESAASKSDMDRAEVKLKLALNRINVASSTR